MIARKTRKRTAMPMPLTRVFCGSKNNLLYGWLRPVPFRGPSEDDVDSTHSESRVWRRIHRSDIQDHAKGDAPLRVPLDGEVVKGRGLDHGPSRVAGRVEGLPH